MSTVRLYQPKTRVVHKPRDGQLTGEIRITPGAVPAAGAEPEGTFAYIEPRAESVEEYSRLRSQGARTFDLWADPYRGRLAAQVVTRSVVQRREAVFEVLDGEGRPLALITREHPLKDG